MSNFPTGVPPAATIHSCSLEGFDLASKIANPIALENGKLNGYGVLCGFPTNDKRNGRVASLIESKDGGIMCRYDIKKANTKIESVNRENIFIPTEICKIYKPNAAQWEARVASNYMNPWYTSILGPRQCVLGTIECIDGLKRDVPALNPKLVMFSVASGETNMHTNVHCALKIKNTLPEYFIDEDHAIIDRCGFDFDNHSKKTQMGFNTYVNIIRVGGSHFGMHVVMFEVPFDKYDKVKAMMLLSGSRGESDPDPIGVIGRSVAAIVMGLEPVGV